MTVPPIDISEHHWKIVHDILQKHVPEHDVWVFGSRARRTARAYSDIDMVIVTEHPLTFEASATLAEDFSESDLPFRVDLLDWHAAPGHFRRIVEKDKVVVQTGTATPPELQPMSQPHPV